MRRATPFIITGLAIAGVVTGLSMLGNEQDNVADQSTGIVESIDSSNKNTEDVEIVSDTYLSSSIDSSLLSDTQNNQTNTILENDNAPSDKDITYRPNWRYEGSQDAPQPMVGILLEGTEETRDAPPIHVDGEEERKKAEIGKQQSEPTTSGDEVEKQEQADQPNMVYTNEFIYLVAQ